MIRINQIKVPLEHTSQDIVRRRQEASSPAGHYRHGAGWSVLRLYAGKARIQTFAVRAGQLRGAAAYRCGEILERGYT